MKVRKAFKKVAALGMGVSMLGATVMGAVAADLNEYPNPLFIDDGRFNGVIVLGDSAVSSDTLGAIDIATGLQFSSTTSAGSGSADVTISEGAKIERSGDTFNVNESIQDIESNGLDAADLASVLADGKYDESEGNSDNDEEYTQEIQFFDGTAELILDQDDKDAPVGGLWLKIDKNEDLYNYTLEFDNKIDYDNTSSTTAADDFETSKITIQGNLYTFTNVKLSGGKIDELTLQAGDTTIWLEQGMPITRVVGGEEVEVELVDVNEDETKCGVMVDGQLQWIDVGSTDSIGSLEVGVTDAITVHAESKDTDVCEVNVGATEIKLDAGQEVEINGKEIDGSNVVFKESTAGELQTIAINHQPEDDVYMWEGDTWQDPVLGNWELNFASLSANYEEISAHVSGDDLTLEFMNSDGKEIVLPFFCSGSCDATTDEIYFGESADIDDRYFFKGGTCTGTTDVTDCEGAKFLVNEGDELHVIEIDDVDLNDNETTLKDVTYGGSKTTDNTIGAGASAHDLPAGGGTVQLTVTTAAVTFTGGGSSDEIIAPNAEFETNYEGRLRIGNDMTVNGTSKFPFADHSDNQSRISFEFNETDGEVDSTGEGDSRGQLLLNVTIDTSDDEMNIGTPSMTQPAITGGSGVDLSDSNDDDKIYYSIYGTRVVHDDEDKRWADIWFPEEELAANVFISPIGANIVTSSSSGAVVVQKIEVGTAKLASEVAGLSGQNTIIVGGPCANDMAAEFLGVAMDSCLDGAPEENTAVIQLKDMGDNVAMLVNGYSAIDTRRAARVLANYEDYDLSGEEVVVTGTDFSDIQVSTV